LWFAQNGQEIGAGIVHWDDAARATLHAAT